MFWGRKFQSSETTMKIVLDFLMTTLKTGHEGKQCLQILKESAISSTDIQQRATLPVSNKKSFHNILKLLSV